MTATNDPDFFTPGSAGAWLGGISHQTIRDAIARGDLPAFQPTGRGGRVLIRRDDLLAWVERGRIGEGGGARG